MPKMRPVDPRKTRSGPRISCRNSGSSHTLTTPTAPSSLATASRAASFLFFSYALMAALLPTSMVIYLFVFYYGECLEWKLRYKVALGVAEGLSYLHHTCPRRIIHRDIEASNILLDEDYEPLISDYGLAKWLPDKWLHHVLYPIEGTFGYLAPEYFMYRIVDEKTDVFAFGVLLLELITGRHAVDSSKQSLVMQNLC